MKRIKKIHPALEAHTEGLMTFQAIPTNGLQHIDPFILLNHHGPQDFEPGNAGLPFGPHPHRGFETLTFVIEGDVVHKDSTGSESKITTGGVQWMTAGRGVVHSEVSSEEFKASGGRENLLQLWMNLPARLKMTAPDYQGLTYDELTHFELDEGKVRVNLISGEWNDQKGPANSITDLMMSTVELQQGAAFNLSIPEDRNVLFYVVDGSLEVNQQQADIYQTVEFWPQGEQIEVKALTSSTLILGHGTPNREPIVSYGPFVMNSKKEIMEAFEDYQSGNFLK